MTTKFLALFATLVITLTTGCIPLPDGTGFPGTWPVWTGNGLQVVMTTTGPSAALDLSCEVRSAAPGYGYTPVPCPNLTVIPYGGGTFEVRVPDLPPDSRVRIEGMYQDITGTRRPLFCRSSPEVEDISASFNGWDLRIPSWQGTCRLELDVARVAR